ncbi:exportin-t [Anaeramoeba ignava]|uniref:Exportin-T n=1 Tax=Anaeramoeba ignava TaxID=1746090 RepID=A0A9Q0LI52_ANAIG|nr:exportin-t [Anaeramoeba ignava]
MEEFDHQLDELKLLILTTSNPNIKQEEQKDVVQLLEEFKNTTDSWKLAFYGVFYKKNVNSQLLIFLLSVLSEALEKNPSQFSSDQLNEFKLEVMKWINNSTNAPIFFKNKIAQLFILLTKIEFPERWPNAWTDLITIINQSENNQQLFYRIDTLNRILESLDYYLSPYQIHSPNEVSKIKDDLRLNNVFETIVPLILSTIKLAKNENEVFVNNCFRAISLHIHWFEVSLVVDQDFISEMSSYFSPQTFCEGAFMCLQEIIKKGMDPEAKINLIEELQIKEGILAIELTNEDDIDFYIWISKIVGVIGLKICECSSKILKNINDAQMVEQIWSHLEGWLAVCFRFALSIEQNQDKPILTESQQEYVSQVIEIVITNSKFTDEYDFYNTDTYEQDFQQYRVELLKIFRNIYRLWSSPVENLYTNLLQSIMEAINSGNQVHFSEVEIVLELIYIILDVIPVGDFEKKKSIQNENESFLYQVISTIITSPLSSFQHRSVTPKFFYLVSKVSRFFNLNTEFIPGVMKAFLDERGLLNPDEYIRSEICDSLLRFITETRYHLHPFISDIFASLAPLLEISLQKDSTFFSLDKQLVIFEITGCVLDLSFLKRIKIRNTTDQTNQNQQEVLLEPEEVFLQIINLIGSSITKILAQYSPNNGFSEPYFITLLGHCISSITSFVKRFSTSIQKNEKIVEISNGISDLIWQIATTVVESSEIRQRIIDFCHRIVISLGLNAIPIFSKVIWKMFETSEEFKSRLLPILDEFFIEIVNKISQKIQFLSQKWESELQQEIQHKEDEKLQSNINSIENLKLAVKRSETRREQVLIKQSYHSFLLSVIKNCPELFLTDKNSSHLEEILFAIINDLNSESENNQILMTCFNFFDYSISQWVGTVNGYQNFLFQNVVPLLFDFSVFQDKNHLILGELTQIQFTLIKKCPNDFLDHLKSVVFPALLSNFGDETDLFANQYLNYLNSFLQEKNQKQIAILKREFKEFLQNLFTKISQK